jgi:hypothetical protein
MRLTWKNQWLRRLLLIAWLPAVSLGAALSAFEQLGIRGGPAAPIIMAQLPHARPILERMSVDPIGARHEFWAMILLTLFRYPQGVLMVLLIGIIAPPLIASDLRTRAYLLYFSRPIHRWDYVLGKSFVVWAYLFAITALPALGLYALGVALSPSLDVLTYTWDLPLRILAASIWLILPTTALALCYSSLTGESRYAGFAWFATWALGWVAYSSLTFIELGPPGSPGWENQVASRWTLVSLYHTLGNVQSWVFGLERDYSRVLPAILLLLLITGVALVVLVRRVSAPLRV